MQSSWSSSKHFNWNVTEWKATQPSLRVFSGKLVKWESCKSCKIPYNSLIIILWPVYPIHIRGIEWSLRASASMRAVCLFLRARAVDKIFLASSEHFRNYRWRAGSTLEKYRWRAASTSSYFVSLQLAGISILLIGNVVLRQVIVTVIIVLKPPNQNNGCKPRAAQPIPEAHSQLCFAWCQITSRQWMDAQG